jgi:hypothetical protein
MKLSVPDHRLERGMRRTDKEIRSREEIDEIIRGSHVCRIAMAMDNMPYIVPVSFGYDKVASLTIDWKQYATPTPSCATRRAVWTSRCRIFGSAA